jgi:hypothetical protein
MYLPKFSNPLTFHGKCCRHKADKIEHALFRTLTVPYNFLSDLLEPVIEAGVEFRSIEFRQSIKQLW